MFDGIARRRDTELLVVYETAVEPNRRLDQTRLPYDHEVLQSLTLDLRRWAPSAFVHVPRRPLEPARRFRPDVVVTSEAWTSPANLALWAAREREGWAMVSWWESFRRPRPSLARRVAEPFVRAFARAPDAWVAGGTRAIRNLEELGADPSRIVLSPQVSQPPDTSPPGGGPVPDDAERPRFAFVGQLAEHKGLLPLLEAFSGLPRGSLWLAGDGPLRAAAEGAAAADGRIHVLGHLDWGGLPALYRSVDALVLPSAYDVWGLVVNEAMAHGLPAIVTDQVGAGEDLVDPGVNGYVVPVGSPNALRGALEAIAGWCPERRAACADRNRSKLADWSAERAADGIVEACELALAHRAAAAQAPSGPGAARSAP